MLGCVGRLDPIKAHDVLIDAFARARRRRGARPGAAPAGGRALPARTWSGWSGTAGVADRVRFLGMVRDVPEQLRELDLFVLASHREGRPTSIMEAMASGLPVVATRVGSVPELVADGRTGLLVEPGDAEGLARAIGTLADDGAMRRRFAEEARRFAVAELSVDRMVEQYAAFYRDVARKS